MPQSYCWLVREWQKREYTYMILVSNRFFPSWRQIFERLNRVVGDNPSFGLLFVRGKEDMEICSFTSRLSFPLAVCLGVSYPGKTVGSAGDLGQWIGSTFCTISPPWYCGTTEGSGKGEEKDQETGNPGWRNWKGQAYACQGGARIEKAEIIPQLEKRMSAISGPTGKTIIDDSHPHLWGIAEEEKRNEKLLLFSSQGIGWRSQSAKSEYGKFKIGQRNILFPSVWCHLNGRTTRALRIDTGSKNIQSEIH